MDTLSEELIWKLELKYDGLSSEVSSKQNNEDKNPLQLINCVLLDSNQSNFHQGLESCSALLNSSVPLLKIFAIHRALEMARDKYDFSLRNKWITKWTEVANWQNIPWARYIFTFDLAVTYFYSCALGDSEKLFLQCFELAKSIGYLRGQIQCQFYLGLIYRDKRMKTKANECLLQSRSIAEALCNAKYLQKISSIQSEIDSPYFGDLKRQRILMFLNQGELSSACRFYLQEAKFRKANKIDRKKLSDRAYLALILYSKNKFIKFHEILGQIDDLIIREHVINFAIEHLPATSETSKLYSLRQYLQELLYIPKIDIGGLGDSKRIELDSARYPEIDLLIRTLSQSKTGFSKEELCEKIWKMAYDPLYHDPRLYRLISKAKILTGISDLIENLRGSYRLNQRYI
ncbi:MAG: hypothetical protein ACXWRG_03755 [Bdellovibrio sp.]